MSKNGQVWLDHLQILRILQVGLVKLQTTPIRDKIAISCM